jgi:nucleoside phosphorylase/predicted DNA-binding transcriptional regulator YafY
MKILILTPIQIEQEAVLAHLINISEEIVEGSRYVKGQFKGEHHSFEVVTQQTGSGNSIIALATEKAVKRFHPMAVLLVGVAGGIKDVGIGDVVVGTKYYGYESVHESEQGLKARPWSSHYSKPIRALAKSVAAQQKWWKQLQGDQIPHVVFGAIASGNRVIAGKASTGFQFLNDNYNDTTAIEMEAAGFGEAMSDYPHILMGNIRGISDLIDGKKQAEEAGSQSLAATHAAAFAFAIINQLQPAQFQPIEMELKNRLDDFMELLKVAQKPQLSHKKGEGYHLPPNRAPRELERLQPLSKEDRLYIREALDQLGEDEMAKKVQQKLNSLYDFQQLGLRALARPAIERYERLEQAKLDKTQVVLQAYRSNSNEVRDRTVEPFHVNADLDTLQAFDTEKGQNRHFRLSRIKRVLPTQLPWQSEALHVRKHTDVFRIADNEMVNVQLRLDVLAFNILTEAYPNTRSCIYDGAEPNTYDFEAEVNHQFFGLINFVMGHARHVEVIGPERLKQRIREEAALLLKKME